MPASTSAVSRSVAVNGLDSTGTACHVRVGGSADVFSPLMKRNRGAPWTSLRRELTVQIEAGHPANARVADDDARPAIERERHRRLPRLRL